MICRGQTNGPDEHLFASEPSGVRRGDLGSCSIIVGDEEDPGGRQGVVKLAAAVLIQGLLHKCVQGLGWFSFAGLCSLGFTGAFLRSLQECSEKLPPPKRELFRLKIKNGHGR